MEKTRDTDKALRMVFKMVPYINGRTYKGTKEVGMMTWRRSGLKKVLRGIAPNGAPKHRVSALAVNESAKCVEQKKILIRYAALLVLFVARLRVFFLNKITFLSV